MPITAFQRPGIPGVVNTSGAARLPAEVTKTGTISHTNGSLWVTGAGTLFTSEIKVDDWIYANSVLRKVIAIDNDTRLMVESTFGGDLSGVALNICHSAIYRKIKIENVHASAASTVLGVSLPAGKSVEYIEEAGLEPLFYDGTSSTLLITTMK